MVINKMVLIKISLTYLASSWARVNTLVNSVNRFHLFASIRLWDFRPGTIKFQSHESGEWLRMTPLVREKDEHLVTCNPHREL